MPQPSFVKVLLPEGEVPERIYERTLRRRVRYLLSRLQTEVELGRPVSTPPGFRAYFKDQEWWDGWENWGITWDVGELGSDEGILSVVPRWLSIHEEWDEVIRGELQSNEIAARKRRRMGNGSEGDV
jgi:hypothetical protein